jgi:hypothetical protein
MQMTKGTMRTNPNQIIYVCNFEALLFYRIDMIIFLLRYGSTLTPQLNPETRTPSSESTERIRKRQFEASIDAPWRTTVGGTGGRGGRLPRRRSWGGCRPRLASSPSRSMPIGHPCQRSRSRSRSRCRPLEGWTGRGRGRSCEACVV